MEQTSPSAAVFSPLLCIGRTEETVDAATFEFRHMDSRPFDYQAGQFITFEVDVADELLHRAYSLSSSPAQPETVSITVKRVDQGRVSNFLLDNLQPGHALKALAPAGEFTLQHCRATPKLVLMAAGSGITPCLSIARWLLDTAQQVEIQFIYSARSVADVIMADTLDQLAATHDNFQLQRLLDQCDSPRDGDYQGPLKAELFAQLVPELAGRTLFSCGPEGYMAALRELAQARGMDMALFHQESFAPAELAVEVADDAAQYQLKALQSGITAVARAGETLLTVLEAAGVPVVGACRAGVCGSCKCQLAAGDVASSSQATLTEAEIAAGYVLACSSTVQSDLAIAL